MKEIIFKIIFISIFSFILTENNIPVSNITSLEKITISNYSSSCICIKLSDEIEKGKFDYIILKTNETEASINETLSYNYTLSCHYSTCDNFEFNHIKELNLSKDEDGFAYLYNFTRGDEKFLMVRYYQFTGYNLIVEYSKFDLATDFIAGIILYVGIISLSTIILLILIKCFVLNKIYKKKEGKNNFIAPIFPQGEEKEIEEIKKD